MHLITTFDQKIIKFVQSFQLIWFGKLMAASTFAGNGPTLAVLGLGVGSYSYFTGNTAAPKQFAAVLALILGYNAIKIFFRRKRPENAYSALIKSSSFPSGHSAGSATAYGYMAYILANRSSAGLGLLLLAIGALISLLIGISRVYLGAHYPSDVVAGWLLGLTGLLAVIRFLG